MRTTRLIAVILMSLFTIVLADTKQENTTKDSKKPTLSAFDWMLGSWVLTDKNGTTTETWTKESETSYRGASVTLKGSDTTFHEKLQLVHDSIGIAYIALPKQNTAPTRFSLAVWRESRAEFENLTHDFPKRIIYQFRAPDTLHARIEGPGKDGKTKGIDYVFTRKK